MSRLRVYTVHVKPSLQRSYESAEFVQEGFSWKAFFFSVLWLLYYRVWWGVTGLVAANVAIYQLMHHGYISATGGLILDMAAHLVVAFHCHDWRRAKLRRQGYLTADIVTGDSPLKAELRYFDRYFSLQPFSTAA